MTPARPACALRISLFSVFIGFFQHTIAQPLPPVKHYTINYAKIAPAIDGQLNDDAWATAKFTSDFIQHDTGATPVLKTRAKLLYDNQCLYLGLETEDADIFTYFTHNDDPLFLRNDLAEIFIDANGNGKNYIEIGISASGKYYAMSVPEAKDGLVIPRQLMLAEIPFAITINGTLNRSEDQDKSWTLEACIPLSIIAENTQTSRAIQTSTHWRIGLFRIDYDHTTEKSQALGFYSWQSIGKFGFHRPERFGKISFGKSSNNITPFNGNF